MLQQVVYFRNPSYFPDRLPATHTLHITCEAVISLYKIRRASERVLIRARPGAVRGSQSQRERCSESCSPLREPRKVDDGERTKSVRAPPLGKFANTSNAAKAVRPRRVWCVRRDHISTGAAVLLSARQSLSLGNWSAGLSSLVSDFCSRREIWISSYGNRVLFNGLASAWLENPRNTKCILNYSQIRRLH